MAEGRAVLKTLVGSRTILPSLEPESEEVWEAVRRLPHRQAQVIALTYLDDLSLEQVSQVLGVSVPTVGTHLQRGRTALALSLNIPEEVTP